MKNIFILFALSVFVFFGCSSNQSLLRINKIQKKQTVTITLNSGKIVSGEVAKVDGSSITVVDAFNKPVRVRKTNIHLIRGPKPELDLAGKVISEREIAKLQKNNKKYVFAASGGLLSLGVSFFTSSMLSRGLDGDSRDPVIYGGTVGGTLVGAFLFYRMGARKDRHDAINAIRIKKSKTFRDLRKEREHQKKVQEELEQLKKDRERQAREMEQLKKEIEAKKKKK
ncbi:MAG: hypothetical protein GWP06_14210 [Actinobacteria bacterium]|nr:hypothetical protein [Actinomycetota bacterium]